MSIKPNQYFMYGILVPYNIYLEANTNNTIDDFLKADKDFQGIFTGRNGDFLIVGRVMKTIDDNEDPLIVPELSKIDEAVIEQMVREKYGFEGMFHYYFIKKYK